MTAYGHGSNPQKLSLIEQVEGRKKQVMFQVQLDSEIANTAINDLKQEFKGARIHYWLVPVIQTGMLGKV